MSRESMGRQSVTWASPPPGAIGYDDVLLPLELVDLVKSRPKVSASVADWSTWLFRKASLLDRVASHDPEIQAEMTAAAKEARKAALTLQRQLARQVTRELLTAYEGPHLDEDDVRELLEHANGSTTHRATVGYVAGVA